MAPGSRYRRWRVRHRCPPRPSKGPVDLLLQLVNSHEVDLFDIPLASVVDAFVAEVASWEQVDLQTLSEFLVVAAVLIELKSRRLLPGRDDVRPRRGAGRLGGAGPALARLLECQAYAAAADGFAVLMEQAARSVPRTAGLDDDLVVDAPDLLEGVTPDQVAAAFLRATAERPAPVVDLYHVTVDAVTVADAVSELELRLPGLGRATFRSLTGHLDHPDRDHRPLPGPAGAVQAGPGRPRPGPHLRRPRGGLGGRGRRPAVSVGAGRYDEYEG